ncbi:hypothetical protein N8691_02655, partial [Candidatus Pelagibacter sp.]|nr:hypothetical protein [Candidatus Pelagibacter sp.]
LRFKKKTQNLSTNLINFCKKKTYIEKKKENINLICSQKDVQIHINDLSEKGFTFVDNFFDEKSISIIKSIWPPDYFFYAPDNPLKNYSFGFRYLNNQFQTSDDFDRCQNFKKFYFYLLADKFTNYINQIIGVKNYKIFSIVASIAREKSYLIPHQDTIINDNNIRNIVNVIFFVDGDYNAEFSGGTGIYQDNEFKEPKFIPPNVKNSAIIYNSKKNLFHGFDIMKKKTFRKAISFQLMEIK